MEFDCIDRYSRGSRRKIWERRNRERGEQRRKEKGGYGITSVSGLLPEIAMEPLFSSISHQFSLNLHCNSTTAHRLELIPNWDKQRNGH